VALLVALHGWWPCMRAIGRTENLTQIVRWHRRVLYEPSTFPVDRARNEPHITAQCHAEGFACRVGSA